MVFSKKKYNAFYTNGIINVYQYRKCCITTMHFFHRVFNSFLNFSRYFANCPITHIPWSFTDIIHFLDFFGKKSFKEEIIGFNKIRHIVAVSSIRPSAYLRLATSMSRMRRLTVIWAKKTLKCILQSEGICKRLIIIYICA